MLDPIMDLIDRVAPPPKRPEPFTLEIQVPRDHPCLPRLVAAAAKLPNVEVIRASGLHVKKHQPTVDPQVVQEFFGSLREVVGDTMADELEERLSVRTTVQRRDPAALLDLCRAAMHVLPIGALQQMTQGER